MPWQHMLNFRFSQDFYVNVKGRRNTISLGLDVNNIANMLNRDWGNVKRISTTNPEIRERRLHVQQTHMVEVRRHDFDLVGDVQHPLHLQLISRKRLKKEETGLRRSLPFVYMQYDCNNRRRRASHAASGSR